MLKMTQIQFKKIKPLQLIHAEMKSHKADCLECKTKHLQKRLRACKHVLMQQPSLTKLSISKKHNLRQSWFCTNCLQIFHLKPVKKFKTLQLFNLRCPHCHSGEVFHNRELTEAIAKQKQHDKLINICKERGIEIEYGIKNNTKYFPLPSVMII